MADPDAPQGKKSTRLLLGVDDDALDDGLVRQLKAIRQRNRILRYQLGRFKRAVQNYALDNTIPKAEAPLYALRELVERAEKVARHLYPHAICPECDGNGDESCPECFGRWWVSKIQYWAWRRAHDPLPEPTTPNITQP